MPTDHAFRVQLDRARRLQLAQAATQPSEPDLPAAPDALGQVRRRAAERRLPAPRAASMTRTGQLTAGRLKLPSELRVLLGQDEAGTPVEVRITVHGPQLLIAPVHGDQDGARAMVDGHGRLQLSVGQRAVLGIDARATVLLVADQDTRTVRIVDPARLHALLDELTPLTAVPDEAAVPTSTIDHQPKLRLVSDHGG